MIKYGDGDRAGPRSYDEGASDSLHETSRRIARSKAIMWKSCALFCEEGAELREMPRGWALFPEIHVRRALRQYPFMPAVH
jgi:hypothetical protein